MTSVRKRVQDLVLGSALLGSALLTATGCAVNAATGERQFMLISESEEIEMGRESDVQITESLGLYESAALQASVTNIGNDLASSSERSGDSPGGRSDTAFFCVSNALGVSPVMK